MCQLERDGSHMRSHDRFNLFSSTDEWTSPVVAEVGPDGTVWISDWYNYIVQHNPTPLGFKTGKGNAYETPLRDKQHGRIYRIVNTTTPAGKPFAIDKLTPSELVTVLKQDNMFWRMQAQWALVATKDERVGSELWSMAVSKQAAPATAVHALWTLKGLGLILQDKGPYDALLEALRHPAPEVRRAAVDVLPRTEAAALAILNGKLLEDLDPLVRRSALAALGESPAINGAGARILALMSKQENARDRWIPLAATTAAAKNSSEFLVAYLVDPKPGDRLNGIAAIVSEHFAREADSAALPAVLVALRSSSPAAAATVLAGLAKGWPAEKAPTLDEKTQGEVVALMDTLDTEAQPQLALLAQRWGFGERIEEVLSGLRAKLAGEVADSERDDSRRIAAARRLMQLNPDRGTFDALLGNLTARTSPTMASGLLDAIGQASSDEVAPVLIERWNQLTPSLRKQVIEILLRRPEWSRALVDAIEADGIASADLAVDQSQRLANHPNKSIAQRAKAIFSRGGGLPSPDREKVVAELLPLAQKTGDVSAGRLVFEKNCAKCHRHGEMGENIGPNLTGFAVHPKDKILAEVLDPNRSVEGNFRQYTVATTDGQVLAGLLASETRTAIELVDSEAKRHVVLRENIDEMIASPKSLMPEGFEKQLSADDFTNLLEFLSVKGKFVPLPIDKVASLVSTRGMFYDKTAELERLVFADWSPKTFDGIPFVLIDPRGDRVPNVIVLHSPNGAVSSQMPKAVEVPCGMTAKAIHFLSGVSGWGYPYGPEGSVSVIARLHYADGETEDHSLKNGVQFADYVRRVDVPGSKFAQMLRGQQIRTFAIEPKREAVVAKIELIKGDDTTAPVVMAITAEGR
jgi:putative heme-binding domain-containing protein